MAGLVLRRSFSPATPFQSCFLHSLSVSAATIQTPVNSFGSVAAVVGLPERLATQTASKSALFIMGCLSQTIAAIWESPRPRSFTPEFRRLPLVSSARRQGHFQAQAGDLFELGIFARKHQAEDRPFFFLRQIGVLDQIHPACLCD